MQPNPDDIDLFCVERAVWIAGRKIGLPVYDFPFEVLMACSHSSFGMDTITAVARCGAVDDYDRFYGEFAERGIRLVHDPEQHRLCSELPAWYPVLQDLTAESWWFDKAPDAETAGRLAGWPLFLKGSRQTSRHKAKLSIIQGPDEYDTAVASFAGDRILHWQQMVIRRFERLRPVPAEMGERIPASFEFRTFWWHGRLAAAGPYFAEFADYTWTPQEEREALAVAEEAARRVALPFVVVDVGQRLDGRWIVIEINDAQEAGYSGIARLPMWNRIVELERERLALT